MPRFDADPTKVSATQEIYPAGDYEAVVESVKPFVKMNDDGVTPKNWGIRYVLRIAEGPYQGKPIFVSLYEHSEAAKPMNKRFVMAATGYPGGRVHEQRFDADFGNAEWWMDTDSGEVGDGWKLPLGKRVINTLSVGINKQSGDEQQESKGFRPVG